ncbi:MAG: hypothetical protein ABI867_24485 [Kofleriaceae bacterium]
MSTDGEREELVARLEALKQKTEDLQAKLQPRPNPLVVALRVFLLLGVPALVGVGVFVATDSILYGALALIGAFVVVVAIALKLTPAPPGPGSRAWEADMNAKLLGDVIAARRADQAGAADAAARDRLEREIAFLTQQLDEARMVAASGDRSPGRGFVGFTPYAGD